MITIKIIATICAVIMSFWFLIAKINGASAFLTLIIKLLSLITFIYFGSELIKLIP